MPSFIKYFLKWVKLKERLHHQSHKPPLVSNRDIWWVSIGENIGSELNGKSDLFSRPAIIFKKLSHGLYFIIPTTTQNKEGSWFVPFKHRGKKMVACLHQARVIDYRRLSNKIGKIDTDDYRRVSEGFSCLYIKIPHSSEERGRD